MLVLKDREGASLTPEEDFRLTAFWMRTLYQREWDFMEGRRSNYDWSAPFARNFAAYGSLRRTWHGERRSAQGSGKDNFDPSFIEYIETEVIRE